MQIKRGQLKPAFGTARTQRFPAALAPEYAPIDERTCADQMSFALDFAKLLSYYDDSNRLAGDWSGFFERDLAFLLARIVTTDFQREHFQAVAMQSAVRDGREGIKEILKSIYKAISRIDDWYRWAKEIADKELADNPVRMTLESIIQSDLSQYLGENMASILQRLPQTPGIESWPDYWNRWESRLHAVWRDLPPGAPSFTPALHPNPMDSLVAILQGVDHANHKLQQLARQYLEEMLSKRSDHPPHAALYIAFAKLLELLRGKINGTAGRHLDFYYRDVLGLTERDSSPDVAHLSFELAPQLREFILPAGTRLAAGKETNGALREYATDSDLFINRARVGSLKALYLARDRYATSRNAPDRVINILALPKCDSEDGLGEPLRDAAAGWPTFGVNETSGRCVLEAQLNADLGFILSSSTLLLQEGERNITISIAFHEGNSLESALQAYQDVAADILDQPPAVELLLEDAFHLWLSTEKGWMLVSHPSFRRHPVVGTTMEIEFTLQPTDPPIVANSELAPEPQQSHWPMLKLALNPFARIFAYSFFKDLTIETIDIRVSVRGLKKMQLRNDIGLLSAAQPFPAFGPAPVQGSYLLLTHPELQVKRVDHAALTMTWFNLPKPPASLTSLYDAYNLGITDDSFKVRLSVFSSGTWIPPAINGLLPLFTRDFDRSGVLPATVVAFEVPELASPPGEPLLEPVPEEFTESQSPRGTIRLELAEPEFAFGHSIFPRLMADAAIANAQAGKNGQHTPLPNPPLTPVLKSLVLDYDAAERLDLSRPLPEGHSSRFYHLSPFGYAEHQGRAIRMFTEFSEQGHLYLGMAEIGPQQSLTLLFHIRDAGFSPVPALHEHKDAPAPRLHWRYLTRNEWKDFPAEHVISDSTMGLTRSGIVKFLLPEDITVENTVMPAGICWIEAASEQVEGIYWCHVVSLATQAVTATRICDPHMELLPPVLPAGSITQFVEKKPQIKAISQPFDSRLGRTKEDAAAFRMRVSERLRHKGRAIQNFDFERLILDAFPQVGQVKCIGHNNSRGFPGIEPLKPGMLYLIAVPRLENCLEREPRLPQFVLQQIEDFIRPLTSTSVKDIHVINPVYETLKIFANVEFSGEGDASYYTDDLDAAVSQYLQPWRRTPGDPLYIGSGQVQGYELAKFIQNQPYVKQLQKLVMLHTFQREEGYLSRWRSVEKRVWASAPWAVLMPAVKHGIVAVSPGAAAVDEGIRNLVVGNDFVMNGIDTKEQKEKSPERRYFLVIPRSAVLSAGRD